MDFTRMYRYRRLCGISTGGPYTARFPCGFNLAIASLPNGKPRGRTIEKSQLRTGVSQRFHVSVSSLDAALVHGRYAYDLERNSMHFRNLAWVKNGCCVSDYSLAWVEALQAVSKGFLEKSHLRLRGEKMEMQFKPKYL